MEANLEHVQSDDQFLDVEFYTLYYPDLASLNEDDARRHFSRFGQREQRHSNPRVMIAALEREFGPLEADFDIDRYRDLHPHLKRRPHYDWEVIEHHLRNRAALLLIARGSKKRRGAASLAQQPAARVARSWVQVRLARLSATFGDEQVDLSLVQTVADAAAVASVHATHATTFLEDVVLARYFISAPGAKRAQLDSFSAQLKVLYYTLFDCPVGSRSCAEMDVINRLIKAAMALEVAPGRPGSPSLTLLMLAARAAGGLDLDFEGQDTEPFLADFFGRQVMEMRLQPFVTPEQRTLLRQPAAGHSNIPLAALYRKMAGPSALSLPGVDDPSLFNDWFWEEGVWTLGLDYILSGDQLATAAIRVEHDGARCFLSAPEFVGRAIQGALSSDPYALKRGLIQFIDVDRFKGGLSPMIVSASALIYARGFPRVAQPPRSGPVAKASHCAPLDLRLRSNELLVFGRQGNGSPYCMGKDWRGAKVEHRWTSEAAALIAIRLSPEDDGPLDLFLDLRVLNGTSADRINVAWNGQRCAEYACGDPGEGWLQCHLGARHRTGREANHLSLMAVKGHIGGAKRSLGVALRRLILARR